MTCQDTAKVTGQRSLFLGVDTATWSIAQFQEAAQFARAHSFDTLFVKVGEGTWTWYGGLAGWENIRKAIQAEGVGAIGYFYSKGNTLGALDGEIDLLIAYMRADGIIMADMEVEWNGDVASAHHLCARMRPEPGIFLVSTWGNPDEQAWAGVVQALNPCVNSYLPQQYTNYLSSCWQQYGALGAACIMPTFMIGQDFGPNDPVANAHAAHNQGHAAMSIWYYDKAIVDPTLVDQILAAFPSAPKPQVHQPAWKQHASLANGGTKAVAISDIQKTSFEKSWALGSHTDGVGSGIYNAWMDMQARGFRIPPPSSEEYEDTDWSGNKIVVRQFSDVRCEWRKNNQGQFQAYWYGPYGEIVL